MDIFYLKKKSSRYKTISTTNFIRKQKINMIKELELASIRSNLIQQEETIIFSLIERAQFKINSKIYNYKEIKIPDYSFSFMEYLLKKTEDIHALAGRYNSPEENPFNSDLEKSIIQEQQYKWPIKKNKININSRILKIYVNDIIPLICKEGDDQNYGSSAVNDVTVLQALSKRIHYGKYVAESKYLQNTAEYKKIIKNKDKDLLMEKITNQEVENQILERVFIKGKIYGQSFNNTEKENKITPDIIRFIYLNWIIPLTKDVEILYLFNRKDN